MSRQQVFLISLVLIGSLILAGCGGDDTEEPKTITTLTISFDPLSPGPTESFSYSDTDSIDDIVISRSTIYNIKLNIERDSAGTLTDVDQLISDNAEQYQIFYVVDPPDSPTIIANLSYLDADINGLPIGLNVSATTLGAGDKTFTITVKKIEGGKSAQDIDDPDSSPGTVEIEAIFNLTVE